MSQAAFSLPWPLPLVYSSCSHRVGVPRVPHPFRYGVAAIAARPLTLAIATLSFLCIANLIRRLGTGCTHTDRHPDRHRLPASTTRWWSSTACARICIATAVRPSRSSPTAASSGQATRSIGTQITVLPILRCHSGVWGATLQQFVATMLVGFVSGMYGARSSTPPKSWRPGTNARFSIAITKGRLPGNCRNRLIHFCSITGALRPP